MSSTVWSILTSAATSAGIFALGRQWLTTQIEQRIKHHYDVKLEDFRSTSNARLEELKSQLSRNNTSLELAHRTLSSYSGPFHQKRLESIMKYWETIIEMENKMPVQLFVIDMLLPSEYPMGIQKGKFTQIDRNAGAAVMEEITHAPIEQVRPFVGETLWNLLYAYRALLGRMCYLYHEGIRTKNIKPWFDDAHCLTLVKSLISEQHFIEFVKLKVGKYSTVKLYIRERIATAVGAAANGATDSEVQLREAHRLSVAATAADLDLQK
ncbi:hypothetical protein F3J14_01135 [Burkholderia sp. Tr-862]|uniref:hypothetical protein n=1 Tax=Burkholderia sp. Tr-862 TaxID=2608331 RepID=UPI001419369F|nr:hypothetical protein [Burkholderia sp. Tr-862]NIF39529.1 hypothetical protein [Burkholderia sp. Tr-862]